MIYGREKARYTYTYTDINNATIEDTFDWILSDKLLDNSDNTSTFDDQKTELLVYPESEKFA